MTQVVSAVEGHSFHNRLTHTLKVAQLARRIAERLCKLDPIKDAQPPLSGASASDEVFLDPEVCYAAGLAHDLGHPPFGHAGETALMRLTGKQLPNDPFEGNPQSFRIVTKVSHTASRKGLDLTRATLAGILKYPWPHSQMEKSKASRKWGAYGAEHKEMAFALNIRPSMVADLEPADEAPRKKVRKTLEAQIMDWADDIVYAIHDVEDFTRSGLIPLHLFRRELSEHRRSRTSKVETPELNEYVTWVRQRWKEFKGDARVATKAEIRSALESGLKYFGSQRPYVANRESRQAMRAFTSAAIAQAVEATKLTVSRGQHALDIDPDFRRIIDSLKELTWKFVILSPALTTQQQGKEKIVETVFEAYWAALDGKKPTPLEVLPPWSLDMLRPNPNLSDRTRIVCDAICSLTDADATSVYRRLTGNDLGSVMTHTS